MNTKYIIDSIRNDIIQGYNYSMYGDGLMEKELLNSELKSLGIINGEDEMVWESPDKSIYFEVSRDYSTTKSGVEAGYQYNCTLNVKNNLGVSLDVVRFSELDAIRILDSFVYFNEPDYISDDHNTVYINISPQDTSMEFRTIILEQVISGPNTSVIFTLQKYNPFYQQIVPIVKIPMTYEQLNDLAFHIFFAILIDIEVPVEYDETMFRIEDYVTTGNYWTYERRRQELVQYSEQHPEKAKYATSFMNDNAYYLLNQSYEAPMNTPIVNNIEQKPKPKRQIIAQVHKKKRG